MMSLWDALRMNMMISYQELVRTFLSGINWEIVCKQRAIIASLRLAFNKADMIGPPRRDDGT